MRTVAIVLTALSLACTSTPNTPDAGSANAPDAGNTTAPDAGTSSQAKYCVACTTDTDCGGSNHCLTASVGRLVCGATCDQFHDCPEGATCAPITDDSGASLGSQCVPTSGVCPAGSRWGYCAACRNNADCTLDGDTTALCLSLPSPSPVSFCGTDCSGGEACPSGATCDSVGNESNAFGGKQCVPTSGFCSTTCGASGDECDDRSCCSGLSCNTYATGRFCGPSQCSDSYSFAACTSDLDCCYGVACLLDAGQYQCIYQEGDPSGSPCGEGWVNGCGFGLACVDGQCACIPNGSPCTTVVDCCTGSYGASCSEGVCVQACGDNGQSCSADTDCCSGTCRDGKCGPTSCTGALAQACDANTCCGDGLSCGMSESTGQCAQQCCVDGGGACQQDSDCCFRQCDSQLDCNAFCARACTNNHCCEPPGSICSTGTDCCSGSCNAGSLCD